VLFESGDESPHSIKSLKLRRLRGVLMFITGDVGKVTLKTSDEKTVLPL